MKIITHFSSIVLISLGLTGIVVAQDIESLRNLIFGVDPKLGYQNPEKTLEYLKKLLSFKPEDSQYLTQLINLSEHHSDKCDEFFIRPFFVLNQQDSLGIEAYKRHHWNERKYVCKEIWKKNLAFEVTTLTAEEKRLVNQLTMSVFQHIPMFNYKSKFIGVGTRQFSSGVLPYFTANTNYQIRKIIKGLGHRQLYDREYKRLLIDLCANIKSKLKGTIDLFKLFIYTDQSNFVDDDQYTKYWLENVEVCKTVDSRGFPIEIELYKLLKQRYPQPGCCVCCQGGLYVVD